MQYAIVSKWAVPPLTTPFDVSSRGTNRDKWTGKCGFPSSRQVLQYTSMYGDDMRPYRQCKVDLTIAISLDALTAFQVNCTVGC